MRAADAGKAKAVAAALAARTKQQTPLHKIGRFAHFSLAKYPAALYSVEVPEHMNAEIDRKENDP